MLTAPAPKTCAPGTSAPGEAGGIGPDVGGPRPDGPAYGEWRLDGGGWVPGDGGPPPGYVGWGVPMGSLAFELFDLVGPGEPVPPFPDGAGSSHAGTDPSQDGAGPPAAGPRPDPSPAGGTSPGGPLHHRAGPSVAGCADRPRADDTDALFANDVAPPPTDGSGAGLPPLAGPMLSAVLGVAAMGDEACLDLMARAARSVARWQGVLVRAMARFAELRPPVERGDDYSVFADDEIAPVLNVSPGSAAHRLSTAFTLATRLPATLDALETGTIDYGRVMAMVEITRPLSDAHAKAVEDSVLAGGARPSHAAFRQAARRAALKIDPEGAEQRRRDAKADRCVTTRPMEDGAAELGVKLPAELAQAAYDRIDGLAKKAAGPDEPRTLDQLRADTAADLLLGTNREHLSVEVHVTVPLPTLLGLSTNPGELEGYGPIPAELARELATNATWRRIVTDPVDGTVLDVGRRRYPSAHLARHVQTRDKTCRFPGCPRRARKVDLDHTRRYADGGGTHDGQISALCRHHHRMKDEEKEPTGWTLTQPAPGHLQWTSPTGRVYHVGPTPADHYPPHAPGRNERNGGNGAGANSSTCSSSCGTGGDGGRPVKRANLGDGGDDPAIPGGATGATGATGNDGSWPIRLDHGLGDHLPSGNPWSSEYGDPPF